MILIPKESTKLKSEIRSAIKRMPHGDEKRVAMRQFIEEAEKLKGEKFDFIAYPAFSGLIPAILFRTIYGKELPLFEYMTISSLGKDTIATERKDYHVSFSRKAEPIIEGMRKDLVSFAKRNGIDLATAKVLLIDANIAKGITVSYFVSVLEKIGANPKNLTLAITDSRASGEKLKRASKNLLRGGKLVLFNQQNMTNKVFDTVLTVSAYKKDSKTFKTFDGERIRYDRKQISFHPYFLALALFKEEIAHGRVESR